MPLTFPAPDSRRLTRSPLQLVVCQVRHERRLIVSEGKTALAVQEALNVSGWSYPQLDEVTGAQVNVVMGPGAAPNVSETQTSGWRFASADGAWVVTLMPDHFALETTAYTTWSEDFEPRLSQLIDAVAERVEPTLESRVGMRYIDRISDLNLTKLAAWKPYLRPELLGMALHPNIGPGVVQSEQHLLIALDDGVTAGLRHGPVAEPGKGTVDYLLDYDISRQRGRTFDAVEIKQVADQFNTYALQLFHASVTDQLLDELR